MKYLSADNWAAGNLYVFFPAKQRGILQCWINDESIDDQNIPNCEKFQILHTNAKWLLKMLSFMKIQDILICLSAHYAIHIC